MREIKFRLRDNKTKEWISPYDVKIDGKGRLFLERNLFPPGDNYYTDDRFDVCFYTGLHDKNGKEIYEEDIVTFAREADNDDRHEIREKNIVRWSEYVPGFAPMAEGPVELESIEVIGNIYENPDLLK